LSSSAALEVASGLALIHAAGKRLAPLKLARLCQRAENQFVGLNCGIMDQFTALFAQAGSALFLDTRSLLYRHVPLPAAEEYVIVICDSGVKHSLAASEYNVRRRECEEAVEILKTRLPDIRSLRDISPEEFLANQEILPPALRKRSRHVIFETERTRQARDTLESGGLQGFGRLMNESHESLRDLYEVSCEALDLLVSLARDIPGVLGSRMTGGGFGGCTVSLVEAGMAEEFRGRMAAAYKQAAGLECRTFVSAAGGPAGVYRRSESSRLES
jgi:galactokinase